MRRAAWGFAFTIAALTAIGAAGPAHAMSFESLPTRTDGSQFSDPDEQFDDLAHPNQAAPLHLFGRGPAGDQFPSNWYVTPWYFGEDHRTPRHPTFPHKVHQ